MTQVAAKGNESDGMMRTAHADLVREPASGPVSVKSGIISGHPLCITHLALSSSSSKLRNKLACSTKLTD